MEKPMRPMRFLFVGFQRAWKPLKGLDAPPGAVCELRSLPGNLVAWGSAKDEAVENLRKAVLAAMAKATSPDAWYESVLHGMSPDDRKDANFFWNRVLLERLDLSHFEDGEEFLGLKTPMEYAAFVEQEDHASVPCKA